ncbi:hypothetical protein HYT51_01645 [Candidatus Woesearchaeota archaeon]|nr:hypothetical protein [Candidatus Woesearchaeota archaeon]
MALYDLISNLESFGFYDYVLPFLLIFTIIFAILEKTKILGTEEGHPRKNINFVLAMVIALIVLVQTNIVGLMTAYLSKMALVILIVVVFFLVIGIFGANAEEGFTGWPLIVGVIFAILMAIWALNPNGVYDLSFPSWFLPTQSDRAVLIVLAVGIIALWLIVGGGGGRRRTGGGLAEVIDQGLRGVGRGRH